MTALPRSPTVLERYITMRTRCGSALTPALNVDGLNLIQSQAARAPGLSASIAARPRRRSDRMNDGMSGSSQQNETRVVPQVRLILTHSGRLDTFPYWISVQLNNRGLIFGRKEVQQARVRRLLLPFRHSSPSGTGKCGAVVTDAGLRFERHRNGIPTIDPGTAPTSRLRTRHRLVQISTINEMDY